MVQAEEKPKQFIVIARTGIEGNEGKNTGCQILPEDSLYTAIFTQVHGPASKLDCETFVKDNCDS